MASKDLPVLGGLEDERRAHLAMMLHRYVAEIEKLIGRLTEGNFGEAAQLPKLKREMMSVAKQLRDAEVELEDERKRTEGRSTRRGAGEPIDMDAARDALRSRLDRLRAARGAGDVHS